ncbi:MAG: hypothetical protein MZU95_02910 [Desulfomicrobium escambiense]|nr:hypothetical protein [Desulfomicrobium escambiense]
MIQSCSSSSPPTCRKIPALSPQNAEGGGEFSTGIGLPWFHITKWIAPGLKQRGGKDPH